MPLRLLLVLAPLALVLLWLAWCAWRGRLPSRPMLNAVFSALLLVYVLTTAGLGLFWVANQHLPVFDWHYLFGYAMLLVLAVHLVFNLRQLWFHLGRRPSVVPSRRPALRVLVGAGGAAAFGGLAFWLGLRQGRTVLSVPVASGPGVGAGAGVGAAGVGSAAALALIEQFHAHSSHTRAGLLRRAASVDWGDPPPPFKAQPRARARVSLERQAARAAPALAPGLPQLGALLWHTAGVSLQRGGILFRTAPSSGALFATELYVATRERPGLAAGLWHYHGGDHQLVQLSQGDPPPALLPPPAELIIWATAVFRRSGHKYGDRTYRYVLADLGHALENLRQAGQALGQPVRLLPRFDEAAVAQALNIDEAEEGVLACAWVGTAALPITLVAGAAAATPAPAEWTAAPLGAGSAPLGVTDAVHRATSLRQGAAAATRPPPAASVLPPAGPAMALPVEPLRGTDALPLMARRRSLRRYSASALALNDLAGVLAAMVQVPAQLSDAVQIHLVSHRVDGLPAAAWRYRVATHELLPSRYHDSSAVRRQSQAAGLDQEVIGDAAVVVVLTVVRQRFAANPEGAARGYRHAFIEAGLMGERVYLEAEARGLGACGVGAFYDDDAAALIGVDAASEWPLHFVALGVRPD